MQRRGRLRHWYEHSARHGYFRVQYNFVSVMLEAGRIEEAVPRLELAARGSPPAGREAAVTLARGHQRGALDALAARLS